MRGRASPPLCDAHLPTLLRYSGSLEGCPSWTPLSPHLGCTGASLTPLRATMIPAMQFHRLAPGTPARYLREVASFATYYDRSPDHLMSDAMRASLHHLLVERPDTVGQPHDSLNSLRGEVYP